MPVFLVKIIFLIKSGYSVHKPLTQWLFLERTMILWYAAKLLYVYFPFHYIDYQKESVLKGHDLIKLIILTSSSRAFLSEGGIFIFYCKCAVLKNTATASTVWYYCLDLCCDISSFTHQCFCIFSANVNTVDRGQVMS